MATWEYMFVLWSDDFVQAPTHKDGGEWKTTITLRRSDGDEDLPAETKIITVLNQLGEEGWEIVSTNLTHGAYTATGLKNASYQRAHVLGAMYTLKRLTGF